MNLKIALLPGDGIGPEVIKEAVKICDAISKKFDHSITWEEGLVGASAIYKTGESTDPHAHWPSLWSFVYCVDACPKCSPLVFPGAGRAIKPNTGLIIIFPGDVSHYVPKQECEHNRVIISGNITIKLEQAR